MDYTYLLLRSPHDLQEPRKIFLYKAHAMNGGWLPYGLFVAAFVRRGKLAWREGMRTLLYRQNFRPCFFTQRWKRLW